MKRQEQKSSDTWRMEDLYETEELYRADEQRLDEKLTEFAKFEGTLSEDAQQLLKALQCYEEMNLIFENLYVYANQHYHEDTANAFYQKMSGEMAVKGAKLSECSSFFEPEILAIPEEKLTSFQAECPQLKRYERFLFQITRMREHTLSAKEEALLARVDELGQGPSNIFSMFNNADICFPDIADENGDMHPLTIGRYISYLENKDRVLRKNAFEALYTVYKQHINTLAATYYANAKQADFFAKERKFAGTRAQMLGQNAIPMKVYDQLIEMVQEKLPLMHRYVALRKKLLGYEELHMYDVHVPMAAKSEKEYSFDEAKEIVKKGLKPLGQDYLDLLQEGFDNRWIDVYENEGKRTGAYSWGAYGTHPYVLLNYQGSLNHVFTLAHEMGHALHSWYSDHNQNYLDAGYRIFVAEVASTCNEALLIRSLLDESQDKEERRYLINYFLDQFKSTMFRQTMFAEFEKITHDKVNQGEVLTAEELCEIYRGLNQQYFGDEMVSDDFIAYEWARIPHFYTPFYVYQYSTGFAAAIAISSKILKGEESIVEKYKQFLSGGSSKDPIDLLRICGIDMESRTPVEEALNVFEEFIIELEKES